MNKQKKKKTNRQNKHNHKKSNKEKHKNPYKDKQVQMIKKIRTAKPLGPITEPVVLNHPHFYEK